MATYLSLRTVLGVLHNAMSEVAVVHIHRPGERIIHTVPLLTGKWKGKWVVVYAAVTRGFPEFTSEDISTLQLRWVGGIALEAWKSSTMIPQVPDYVEQMESVVDRRACKG